MIPARRVASNTAVMLTGQVLSLLMNLFVMILIARSLGEEAFGLFAFVIAYVGIVSVVADFGIGPILIRELSRESFSKEKILGTSIVLRVLLSVVAIVLMNVTAMLMGYSFDIIVLANIIVANIFFSAKMSIYRGLFESIFKASLRMEIPVIFSFIDNALLLALTIGLVDEYSSLVTVAVIYTFSNVPGSLLLAYSSLKRLKPSFRVEKEQIKFVLRESFPLALYVFFMAIYDKIDILILKSLSGDYATGIYAASKRLSMPLIFIPAAIVSSLYPFMSRYHRESNQKLSFVYSIGVKILALIGLGMGVFVLFRSDQIISLVYGGKFQTAALPFAILIWAQVFIFLSFFQVDFNTAIHRQRINLVYAVGLSLLNVVLDVILILYWAETGAAIAKLVSVGAGCIFITAKTVSSVTFSFPKFLGKSVIVVGLSSLLVWTLRDMNLIVVGISLFLSIVILSLTLHLFNKTEILTLRQVVWQG
ncbi:MAG: flippase [Bacteroidota bacterium]